MNGRPPMNGAREPPRRQKLINDDEPSAPSSAFNNVYYKKKDKKEVKNEKGVAFAAFLDRHTDEQPAWKHLDSESALKMMGDDAKRDINKMLPLMGDINGYDEEAPEEYKPKKSKHPKGSAFASFVNSVSEGQPVNIAGRVAKLQLSTTQYCFFSFRWFPSGFHCRKLVPLINPVSFHCLNLSPFQQF